MRFISAGYVSSFGCRSIAAALAWALLAPQPSLATARDAPSRVRNGHAGPPSSVFKALKAPGIVTPVAPPDLPPPPSPVASQMIAWVAASRDNGGLPYIVIDKQAAALFLFDAKGTLLGQVPVLLGVGIGDDSSPGVGSKNLAQIGPAERTTPAGRFIARFGRAYGGQRVLWVDYANSVALHAVITANKKERRLARLQSPTPDDNRVTYGCINVGTRFYSGSLAPLFRRKGGVVYILPDTRPLDEVFPRARLLPYLGQGT